MSNVKYVNLKGKMKQGPLGFAAGTPVRTKEGLKAIEEVCVGDFLLTRPDDSEPPMYRIQPHEYLFSRVEKTLNASNVPVSKVIVSGGTQDTLFVTPSHPVYRDGGYKNKNLGWVSFSSLEAGETLVNCASGNLLVYRNYAPEINTDVFNFELETYYTYYVGENALWVHAA